MNKSADEFGLCAEHLKFCKNEIAPYLTKLFNNIIETLKTPNTFKTGILFPVLKKDKDPLLCSSRRILSTHLYQICVQDLLLELERNCLGLNIGNICVGTPTYADGMAFIETDTISKSCLRYSNQHHYKIQPTKIKIVTCGNVTNPDWTLYDTPVTVSKEATNLGMARSWKKEGEINVANRIKLARRTVYALMGSAVHGTNALDPCNIS
ncbi:unnamed protein product [Mytilus coruscus]|uniref:Reverse transcriptase domain-containing protein n=1 Tax=Mytilus coruscus TaxID=42192 RepID=A0A6J8C4G9_MYTCO|nr:unnamed protein product [Mytilus coruscus]